MKRIKGIFRYLDKLTAGQQIAIIFWLLLIDAATLQLLWPWLIWIFGSHPEAMWGMVSPHQKYAADWFFHFFYWSATIGIFSLWLINKEMNFYRWFALFLVIWGSQKVLGMLLLGYLAITGVFNDGCPTYQYMGYDDEGIKTVCVSRGSDIGQDVRQQTDGELGRGIGD